MTAQADERKAGLAARAAGRREDALRHFRAAGAANPADLWSRSDAAFELLALARPVEAAIEARLLLDAAPHWAPAHRALALSLRATGDRAGALAAFEKAAALDPCDPWNRHDAGVELAALGRAGDAEAAFRAVAPGSPLPHSLRGLAGLARERGENETALTLFRAAASLAPADPWFALDVATSLRALGRLDEAEAACAALLAVHPGFVPALLARADLLHRLGRPAEAETLFARLLVRDPGLVAAYRGLARVAAEAGEPDRAAAHLAAATKAAPLDAGLILERAGMLKRAGRWREAHSLLAGLLPRKDTAIPARLELYACVKRDDGPAAALHLLAEAFELDPRHPRTLLMLGDHRREAGDLDGADEAYDAALRHRPGFGWALVGRAAVARSRGATGEAVALLEAALADDGAAEPAAIELAALHREAGDPAAARAALARLAPAARSARPAAMAESLILRAQGRWQDAAESFVAVARRFPAPAEALVEASEDFRRAGADAASAETLREACRVDPDHSGVLDALARRALAADDHAGALRHLGRAAALEPGRLWPPLALARLRATLGEGVAAFAALDACEARFGLRPEIAEARVALLRQFGEVGRAAEILAPARARFPHHPGLCREAVLGAIDAGRFAEAEALIAAIPVAPGGAATARILFLRSLVAAARFDMGEAIRAGEAAVAGLPADGWALNRLVHAALVDLDLDRAGRHLSTLAALEATSSRAKGKSANRSQSHYGQIFDELRLDADALAALAAARSLAPDRRVAALAGVVAEHPDSTAAAIRFFVERQRAPRREPPPPSDAAPIPRVIHQYWNEAAPPDDLARYAASWREHNPGFGYRRWSEAEAHRFMAGVSPDALRAFERAREPAMKADLFRLALLVEGGGIYADMDDRCLAPIEPLLAPGRSMVLYQEDLGSLGNNFIVAAKNHPILAAALRLGVEAVNRGDNDILWLMTGPGLLTRAAAGIVAAEADEGDRLLVLDRHELGAHVAIHCLAGYKATERHWSRTAFGRARPPGGDQAARARSA